MKSKSYEPAGRDESRSACVVTEMERGKGKPSVNENDTPLAFFHNTKLVMVAVVMSLANECG